MGDAIEDNASVLKGAASGIKKGINYILSHSPGETFDTITKKLGKAWDDGNQLAKDLMKFAIKVGEKGTPENALMHQVIDEISGSSNKEKAKMAGYVVADLAIAVLITKGAGQMNKLVKSGELANLATKTIKAMEKIEDVMNKHVDQVFEKVKSIANLGDSYEVVTPEGLRFKISKSEIDSQSVKKIDRMIEGAGKLVVRTLDDIPNADKIINRVKDLRGKLLSDMKKSGNFGLADAKIEGMSRNEFFGFSGVNDLSNATIAERFPDISIKPQSPIFKTFDVPNKAGQLIDASNDSEYKILSDIAMRLGNNTNAKGTISLFTERTPCDSCLSVIEQFHSKFKNIKIDVIHNNGNMLTP